jgi:hypothetical protein
MRHTFISSTLCAVALVVAAPGPGAAETPESVHVTNFPEVQKITGHVVITEPIPSTRFETRKALVSPAARTDANQLTEAGTIDTAGFTHVTLSVGGSLQGSAQPGTVGVVLVPEVPEVLTALRNQGVLQFALEAQAAVSPAQGGLYSSEPATHRVAFPRYRVLLYNTTPKTAEAVVYAYLSGT